jgi:hypothetical protein
VEGRREREIRKTRAGWIGPHVLSRALAVHGDYTNGKGQGGQRFGFSMLGLCEKPAWLPAPLLS